MAIKPQLTQEERERLRKIAGKRFAKVYMHLSFAIDDAEEGEMALEKLGLMRNEIKQNAVRVMKAFDFFFIDFKKYIGKGDGAVILRDFERIKPEIDKVFDLNL